MKIDDFIKDVQSGLPKFVNQVKDLHFDDTGDPDWNEDDWFQAYYTFVQIYGVNPDGISQETEGKADEESEGSGEGTVSTPIANVPDGKLDRHAFLASTNKGVLSVVQAESVEQALAIVRKQNQLDSYLRVHRITIHESASYNA